MQSGDGIFEREFEVKADIFAALCPAAPPATTTKKVTEPEEVSQNIAEVLECVGTEAAGSGCALKTRVPKAIVGRALLRIAQDAVRFRGFFEPLFRRRIVRVAVRVVFQRHFAVSAFDLLLAGIAAHTENFVIISLFHGIHLRFYCDFDHGGPQKFSSEIVPSLEFTQDHLVFHFFGLHTLHGLMQIGIKLLPRRFERF